MTNPLTPDAAKALENKVVVFLTMYKRQGRDPALLHGQQYYDADSRTVLTMAWSAKTGHMNIDVDYDVQPLSEEMATMQSAPIITTEMPYKDLHKRIAKARREVALSKEVIGTALQAYQIGGGDLAALHNRAFYDRPSQSVVKLRMWGERTALEVMILHGIWDISTSFEIPFTQQAGGLSWLIR